MTTRCTAARADGTRCTKTVGVDAATGLCFAHSGGTVGQPRGTAATLSVVVLRPFLAPLVVAEDELRAKADRRRKRCEPFGAGEVEAVADRLAELRGLIEEAGVL